MELWNYVKKHMLKTPFQRLEEGGCSMTYEDAVIFAESFSKHIKKEKCCAIICGSELMQAIALLSCLAANITAVPLSVRYGEIYCNRILDTISPTAVITDMDGKLQVLHLTDSNYSQPKIRPSLIMCTSGTTGVPKGVMLTEENVLITLFNIGDYFKIDSTDSILISRPLYHSAVLTGEFLISLVKGLKIHFVSEKFNPKVLLDLIDEHNITVFCGTPTMLSVMARVMNKNKQSSLRKICVSGECMSKQTAKQIEDAFCDAEIYHVYGLTEAGPRVSYLPPRLFKTNAHTVGIPVSSVCFMVVKPDGKIADINEEGVLWIRGENVMSGYYNQPELTDKVMKKGWLCTGDIAVMDAEGLLNIKGRADDLIIRAGMNIYPQEIENALKFDSRVKEVLAYKIENSKLGIQIGLKISGNFSSTDEVKQLCAELLPSFQMPSVIELVEELPKNSSGKIIREVKKC